MNCSQVLPGAVNPSSCSLATGYCSGEPFVVYASGRDVILLDGHLQHIQTIFGSSCGYGETRVSCVHCAEKTGRLSVGWGSEVVIFRPFFVEETGEVYNREDGSEQKFPYEWNVIQTLNLGHEVLCMSWSADGTRLLTGGACLTVWEVSANLRLTEEQESEEGSEETVGEQERKEEKLELDWQCSMPNPLTHLKFSPSGTFFASCGENDCLVKIWYPTIVEGTGIGSPSTYSYCYIAHPQSVRGFVWRRMTTSFPKGCIPNVLLTHCTDNICRIWSHSLSYAKKGHLRFFIAASIDPVADIPFRTTMPLDDQPFLVHWLNNKETTLTSKVDKFQKGISLPMSHISSVQSFTSNVNEEIFQSWVCIDEDEELDSLMKAGGGGNTGGMGVSKTEVELTHPTTFPRRSSSYGANLHVSTVPGTGGDSRRSSSAVKSTMSSVGQSRMSLQCKRALAHLLDEWCATPDLLLCIHPTVGSLMVWTVEGIDAPINQERLVHVSFSSCLPHVFPPHLAQSLQPDLLQFLIKEPDVLHAREATSEEGGGMPVSTGGGGVTDISLPVPQIRLSSGGSMSAMSHMEMAEDTRRIKPDSTLILVSSHSNGSLNTWSVELTIQSNSCTSIAGLIHCAGTGGHRSKVTQVQRHPWLPILMTISSLEADEGDGRENGSGGEEGRADITSSNKVSELIIWNANLPGPLQNKSKVNELSRLTSHSPGSFKYVTWVPPISTESVQEGALARCPSQGLFVANVGHDLVLFQASLYSITKPQPSSFMQTDKEKGKKEQKDSAMKAAPASPGPASPSQILHKIEVTSQLGVKGIEVVSIIKNDLHKLQEIVGLHVFRMCSMVTTTDLNICKNSKFCKDVLLVLLENRKPEDSAQLSHTSPSSTTLGPKGTKTYLHLWRLSLFSSVVRPPSPAFPTSQTETIKESGNVNPNEVNYSCSIKKIFTEPQPLPLPSGTFVVESSPACDISSSLQLQTPTLSAPYLFSTACSDGTVRCWQFSVEEDTPTSSPERCHTPVPEDEMKCKDISVSLYEVFGSGSNMPELNILRPRMIDCLEEDVIRSLPTESFVPVGIKAAYPGRIAMAHLLSRPVSSSTLHTPRASPTMKGVNPNYRHSMVTIWECESSGGLQWSCEATLMLMGVAQIAAGKDTNRDMKVLMEWVPMENGAYLLVTCFASTISVFGMALPQETEQLAVVKKQTSLRVPEGRTTQTLTRVKAQVSWVCLLEFPCFRMSVVDVPISCLTYTGSNSLIVSIGGELQLYSCWVPRDKLASVSKGHNTTKDKLGISKTPIGNQHMSTGGSSAGGRLGESSNGSNGAVNLLDYAHAWNTPLPQYHPKVLLELMNSGKLVAVKSVLINLIRFILLYRTKKKKKVREDEDHMWTSMEEEEEEEEEAEEEVERKRRRRQKQLSLSSDGYLERSRQSQPRKCVEYIPPLPLSKMGIIGAMEASAPGDLLQQDGGVSQGAGGKSETDDYDELFSMTNIDEIELDDDDENKEVEVTFADLSPEKTEFTLQLSNLLSTLLEDYQLPELNDLDHLQLLSIAQTLASTHTKFSENSVPSTSEGTTVSSTNTLSFSALSGAGYASSSMTSKGREAMDDCGLRYLLALESSEALANCLPEEVLPAPLPPSSVVWAFHSDAETELLSAIPCIREDNLEWEALRKAGIGWWLRSLDTLRRLIEKLAKAVFMKRQQPLDASLFYLAMKKQSLLKTLFKSVADTRMATFFGNDFTSDRWKKAAQKNAFALLGKQRFEEAAAFFLLAGKLWDAVEVCVSRLHDLQLAFVLVRLYEGDHGEMYQKFLKEQILGIPSQPENSLTRGAGGGTRGTSPARGRPRLEANPNPFLRSMVHWLLQDYSGALETLLINPEPSGGSSNSSNGKTTKEGTSHAFLSHPAIFNFYFFLRNHPVLVRRDYKTSFLTSSSSKDSASGSAKSPNLSSVGDEPLTPVERNLLFSTAYYHLSHGCPLLALNVLQRLPKSSNLGADIFEKDTDDSIKQEQSQFGSDFLGRKGDGSVLSGMLQDVGGLGMSKSSTEVANNKGAVNDDDFDWGAPVSTQKLVEDEEVDWSKPFTSNGLSGRFGIEEEEEEEDFDWSKPISSSRVEFSADDNTPELSPTNFDSHDGTLNRERNPQERAPSVLTPWGLFILTLAGQLQYNACLSILTEELHSIYIPSCCLFLWEAKNKGKTRDKEEPILPLTKHKTGSSLKLQQLYNENVFDRTLQNLRGMLVDWLKEEAAAIKTVSHMGVAELSHQGDRQKREDSVNIENVDNDSSDQEVVSTSAPPSGYDLLTTLMNYSALHAATNPSLLAVNFELMHLVNTTLPWGEGSAPHSLSKQQPPSERASETTGALDPNIVPTLAVSPSQLPILTSCSLPVRHLTNLATHLRLLSNCVVKALTNHTYPPISTQPLPQVRRIFDLCCAISHCLTISLNPVQASEFAPSSAPPSRISSTPSPMPPGKLTLTSSQGSLKRTPTPSSALSDLQQQQDPKNNSMQSRGSYSRLKNSPSSQSPFLRHRMDSFSNQDLTIGTPNTKPTKWPGLNTWPAVLTSNEGRDPTPLSVVMVESIVSVYIGLFATAWSQHSIEDLLALLKNGPSMESWYDVVGGGICGKKTERVAKSFFKQTVESMSKRLHLQAKESSLPQDEESLLGIFIAPRRTLLDLFLSPPVEELEEREVSRMESTGYFMVGGTEVVKSDEEDDYDEDDDAFGTGITFKVGGANDSRGSDVAEAAEETSPGNPNCFAWCLMNICVAKILQQTVRRMVAGVNLEVLELITVSPLLYSVLKVLDEWESIFDRRLRALGEAPDDLFGSDNPEETSMFKMGVSLMRQKFIMEPENSPFRGRDKLSKSARRMWRYLVCQSESRDTILQYLYMRKPQSVGLSLDEDSNSVDTDSTASSESTCRVIHKDSDSTISAVCINSCSRSRATVMALALPREVLEIEVQDESYLDSSSQEFTDNGNKATMSPTKRASLANPGRGEDFIMVQTAAQLQRPKNTSMSSLFSPTQIRRSLPTLPGIPSSLGSLSQLSNGPQQTGSANPVLTRRPVAGVKRMAPHPNLAYYLTGSLDGSVYMWEFGTPRHVACPRATGGAVTKIRFTPEGNKFGVTDHQGHLSLWQGIQTSSKSAYHILHSHMKYLTDFLFLGSSSLIATCGDGQDTKNLYLWDTLMPTHRSIVKEFSCHEGGATSLGYCRPKQRLFCGGKKGDVCIYDIRQRSLLQSISLHNSAINCIVVNDIDGYFVTGSSDGDVKIMDCSTLAELASFPGLHAKSRLFRHGEAGVTDMDILPGGKLYSCGADGTIKCQTLQFS